MNESNFGEVFPLLQKRAFYPLVMSLVMCSLFLCYIHINNKYPTYFMWDMDQVSVVDTLVMQSNEIPTHLNHPGFGMYFFLKYTHFVAASLGQLSIKNIADLKNSLQPLLGFNELLEYLRFQSVVAVTLLVAVLTGALLLFQQISFLTVFSLLLVGVQPAFFYHASLIRSELYSVLYWALAIFLLALGSATERRQARILLLIGTGIFASLSFQTKLQSLFYLFNLIGFYFLLETFRPSKKALLLDERKRKILSGANLFFFVALLVSAHFRHPYGATYVDTYPFNNVGKFFLTIIFALYLLEFKRVRDLVRFHGNLEGVHLFVSGFILAFFLHFLVFASPGLALKYMLLDAKMLFFRRFDSLGVHGWQQIWAIVSNLFRSIEISWPSFTVFTLFTAAMLATLKNTNTRAFLLWIYLVHILDLTLAVRGCLRDAIWSETAMNFFSVYYAISLYQNMEIAKILRRTCIVVLGFLVVANFNTVLKIRTDLDVLYNHYGFEQSKMFIHGLEKDSPSTFSKVMDDRYGNPKSEARGAALRLAANYSTIKRVVEFSFPNQNLNLRDVGLLQEGEPISLAGDILIDEVPKELRGTFFVANFKVPSSDLFFANDEMIRASEAFTKREKKHKDAIAFVNRADYDVFLFTKEKSDTEFNRKTLEVVLTGRNGKEVLRGRQLSNYEEIERSALGDLGFFVFSRNYR